MLDYMLKCESSGRAEVCLELRGTLPPYHPMGEDP